jgi:hypothetical protein
VRVAIQELVIIGKNGFACLQRLTANGGITAEEFGLTATRTKLLDIVDEKGLVGKLHELTQEVWLSIEERIKSGRKPKYGGE